MKYVEVISILQSMNRQAKASLGQNFLVNEVYANMITSLLDITASDNTLEIGSGLGALSSFLVKYDGLITLLDYDQDFVTYLKNKYEDERVSVVHGDILKHDLTNYTKIVGNLPYYITTPIIKKVLLEATNLQCFVFMIQKEVALKLLKPYNTKDYSPLHILMGYLGVLKQEKDLKPSNFYPKPHVDSTVLSFKTNVDIDHEFANFLYKETTKLFRFNRKTLLNNLKGNPNSELIIDLLASLNIPLTKRPQEIPSEVYIKIMQSLYNNS